MKNIKVLVNGAHGKMGQETVKAVQADPDLTVVGEYDKGSSLAAMIAEKKPDVVVDFTTPQAVYENVLTIIEANVHPVVGTTGLTEAQVNKIKELCAAKKLGALIVPNFSLGGLLMMQFAKTAAHYLPDVEIVELHHPAKLDAPSGTALRTADLITAARTQVGANAVKESMPGAKGASHQGVPIHSVRLPGFLASQEVIFGNQGETLTIRHNTINREAFMPGVRLACKKVMELNQLIVGLENVLF